MTLDALPPAWHVADVDAPALWAESGGQWLTAPGVPVPVHLVRTVAGLVHYLDGHGADLASISTAGGVGLVAERAALLGLAPSGTISCGGSTRLLQCADGWLAVSLARPDDIASVPAWIGTGIQNGIEDVSSGVAPWATIATVAEGCNTAALVEQAVALGLACAEVGATNDARPVLVERLGDAAARPLDGAVVVNLASLWAGPLAGDVLARAGARVVTVESPHRPDGARHTPRFFDTLHGRCESVALELHTTNGRRQLAALLAAADVVIEGSRPRALEQMGIDATALVRHGPKVWASITGHGRRAPHDERVGFGDDAAAGGGLVGRLDGAPTFIADAVADPLAGLSVAAAIVQLLGSPGRWMVDVALSRVAKAAATGEWTARSSGHRCAVPRARTDAGRPLPLGRDTIGILDEFGID